MRSISCISFYTCLTTSTLSTIILFHFGWAIYFSITFYIWERIKGLDIFCLNSLLILRNLKCPFLLVFKRYCCWCSLLFIALYITNFHIKQNLKLSVTPCQISPTTSFSKKIVHDLYTQSCPPTSFISIWHTLQKMASFFEKLLMLCQKLVTERRNFSLFLIMVRKKGFTPDTHPSATYCVLKLVSDLQLLAEAVCAQGCVPDMYPRMGPRVWLKMCLMMKPEKMCYNCQTEYYARNYDKEEIPNTSQVCMILLI